MKQKSEYLKWFVSRFIFLLFVVSVIGVCTPSTTTIYTPVPETSSSKVPNFDHIVLVSFENREYGKVIGNLMGDLNPSNTKLRDRAVRIVQQLTGVDPVAARGALEASRWVVKDAVKRLAGEKSAVER